MKVKSKFLLMVIFFCLYSRTTQVWAEELPGWRVSIGAGAGAPTQLYSTPSTSAELGLRFMLSPQFELGPVLARTTAKYEQTVDFPNTGYQEQRDYDIESYFLGSKIFLNFSPSWSGTLDLGIASMQSKLGQVTTTAPQPSSVETGKTVFSGPFFAYGAGLDYHYHWGRLALGSSVGYFKVSDSQGLGEIKVMLKLIFSSKSAPQMMEPQKVQPPAAQPSETQTSEPKPSPQSDSSSSECR